MLIGGPVRIHQKGSVGYKLGENLPFVTNRHGGSSAKYRTRWFHSFVRFTDIIDMHWLYDLPTWLLALLIVTLFVSVSLVGLFLTHRRLHRSTLTDQIDNGTVGWFFSGLTLFYGLLLGLLTVAAWGNYNQTMTIVSQEAATIATLYRDLAGYPKPAQNELRYRLRQYVQLVIEKSWPAQQQGKLPTSETAVLNLFQKHFFGLDGFSQSQLVLHAETIRAYNSLVELRRQRLEAINGGVPGVIWAVVLLGAMATIFFSYCFVVKSYLLHATLTGVLSAMIGLMVFLLVVLDHPFWGEVSVSSDAYKAVLYNLMIP